MRAAVLEKVGESTISEVRLLRRFLNAITRCTITATIAIWRQACMIPGYVFGVPAVVSEEMEDLETMSQSTVSEEDVDVQLAQEVSFHAGACAEQRMVIHEETKFDYVMGMDALNVGVRVRPLLLDLSCMTSTDPVAWAHAVALQDRRYRQQLEDEEREEVRLREEALLQEIEDEWRYQCDNERYDLSPEGVG
jgi:hypothetical protein